MGYQKLWDKEKLQFVSDEGIFFLKFQAKQTQNNNTEIFCMPF